ncbi:hypothetical protein Tco_0575455 [Tanacetum coccineum]
MLYPKKLNTLYSRYSMSIFWKISNAVPTPRNPYTPMDDPNMTMEEYIKLKEEKARRHGRVFNWETATYGKIKVDDDLHDLRSVDNAFAP